MYHLCSKCWDSNCQSPSASLPWLMVGVEPLEHWPIHSPFKTWHPIVNQNNVVPPGWKWGKKIEMDSWWFFDIQPVVISGMAGWPKKVFDNPYVLHCLSSQQRLQQRSHGTMLSESLAPACKSRGSWLWLLNRLQILSWICGYRWVVWRKLCHDKAHMFVVMSNAVEVSLRHPKSALWRRSCKAMRLMAHLHPFTSLSKCKSSVLP